MKINHAILHVFDFVSCVNVYSTEELDLSSRNVKRYVTGHAKKALGNIDSKRGEFADLKGLIYFTDGLGQFPEKTPDYDAAFVFMDEEGRELPPVPPYSSG